MRFGLALLSDVKKAGVKCTLNPKPSSAKTLDLCEILQEWLTRAIFFTDVCQEIIKEQNDIFQLHIAL